MGIRFLGIHFIFQNRGQTPKNMQLKKKTQTLAFGSVTMICNYLNAHIYITANFILFPVRMVHKGTYDAHK